MSNGASKRAGTVAKDWWRGLTQADGGKPAQGSRRAALARLRRAANPLQVMMEPHALRLINSLPQYHADRVAIVAGVLAFVRENVDTRIVRIVGRKSLDDEQSAALSENRFRRLLQTPPDDLLGPMRRLVRLAKDANVSDLAESILYWDDQRKKQWIFAYYGAAPAVRSPSQDEAATTPLARQGDTR